MIAVKIERSSYFFSDLLNGNSLTLKLMILIFEKMHPILQFRNAECRMPLTPSLSPRGEGEG
jgi:hypothetical protein